jgi:hypothetical protein
MSSSSRQSSIALEEEEREGARHVLTESPFHIEAWQISVPRLERRSVVQVHESDRQLDRDGRESISGGTDNSQSTLADVFPLTEQDLKTPKLIEKETSAEQDIASESQASSTTAASPAQQFATIPHGPLAEQLLSLLSKVCEIEKDQPTIMASEYQKLEARVAELETEKQTWHQRHEALFALRDEDIANLINVRGLLAHERHEHEAMRKLRDDDLQNVIELRNKLAQATWSASPKQEPSPPTMTTTTINTAATHNRMASSPQAKRLSLGRSPEGTDLWRAAKIAAMEQKVLELESANTDLRAQLDRAHTALLTSSQPTQTQTATNNKAAPGASGSGDIDSNSIGLLFEGALRYRERFIVRIERLRAENDELRKGLSRKEDETAELEHTIEKMRMKIELGL